MPRARDPNRDKAFKLYKSGVTKLKDIADELDIPEGTIRVWKSRDKWGDSNVVALPSAKRIVTKKNETKRKSETKPPDNETISLDNFLEDTNLNEKERMFCLYYVKSFNATQSAINAGYSPVSAHVQGHRLLSYDKISSEIKKLKDQMAKELYIDGRDVMDKVAKIAFSDMGDFLTFGKRMIPILDYGKPVLGEDGEPLMQEVNYVDFKDNILVDGTIISEVKQGKDGVSIKLEDRKWALDKLIQRYDILPDDWKRKIEEEKAKVSNERTKAATEFTKEKTKLIKGNKKDTGILEALIATVNSDD